MGSENDHSKNQGTREEAAQKFSGYEEGGRLPTCAPDSCFSQEDSRKIVFIRSGHQMMKGLTLLLITMSFFLCVECTVDST